MEKTLLLQGKIHKLQQLFAKNQSGGKEQQHSSKSVMYIHRKVMLWYNFFNLYHDIALTY